MPTIEKTALRAVPDQGVPLQRSSRPEGEKLHQPPSSLIWRILAITTFLTILFLPTLIQLIYIDSVPLDGHMGLVIHTVSSMGHGSYPLQGYSLGRTFGSYGPALFYVVYPFSLLAGQPYSVYLFLIVCNGLGGLVLYKFGRDFFSEKAGILCALLYAYSPYTINCTRGFTHPAFLFLFSALFLYTVFAAVLRSRRYLIPACLTLAILLQIHVSAFSAVPVLIAALFLRPRYFFCRHLAAGAVAFVLLFTPYIVQEGRNDFQETRYRLGFLVDRLLGDDPQGREEDDLPFVREEDLMLAFSAGRAFDLFEDSVKHSIGFLGNLDSREEAAALRMFPGRRFRSILAIFRSFMWAQYAAALIGVIGLMAAIPVWIGMRLRARWLHREKLRRQGHKLALLAIFLLGSFGFEYILPRHSWEHYVPIFTVMTALTGVTLSLPLTAIPAKLRKTTRSVHIILFGFLFLGFFSSTYVIARGFAYCTRHDCTSPFFTSSRAHPLWLHKRLARIIPGESALDNLLFWGLSYSEISMFRRPGDRAAGEGRAKVRVLITDTERYPFIDPGRIDAFERLDFDPLHVVTYAPPLVPGSWRWSRTGPDGWMEIDFDEAGWAGLVPGRIYPLSLDGFEKKTFPELSLFVRGAFFREGEIAGPVSIVISTKCNLTIRSAFLNGSSIQFAEAPGESFQYIFFHARTDDLMRSGRNILAIELAQPNKAHLDCIRDFAEDHLFLEVIYIPYREKSREMEEG